MILFEFASEIGDRGVPTVVRRPLDADFLVDAGFRIKVGVTHHVATRPLVRAQYRAAVAARVIEVIRVGLIQVRRLERARDAALDRPVFSQLELHVEAGAEVGWETI